jgi:hypothetical protein
VISQGYEKIDRGLIIRTPWIDMILNGTKTWEMRKQRIAIRGLIALIRKGSGTVVGVANLTDCLAPLTEAEFQSSEQLHGISAAMAPAIMSDRWVIPWVLEDAVAIPPVPYKHRSGAVKWVKLEPDVSLSIAKHMHEQRYTAKS